MIKRPQKTDDLVQNKNLNDNYKYVNYIYFSPTSIIAKGLFLC